MELKVRIIIKEVNCVILQRKIYNKLLEWKEECKGTKAILIEGARRIGKSTVCVSRGNA